MATITTTKYLTLNETISMSPTSTTQQKVAQRKKKAARACVHCQKVFKMYMQEIKIKNSKSSYII